MISLEDFLKRWPGRVDQTTQAEIELFMATVLERADDYDAFVSRLRASGKFKSLFHPTTMTNNYMNILSQRERSAYPGDLYKTILGIAQTGKRPANLTTAISDVLKRDNPNLTGGAGDATHETLLVPLEALLTRKAQNVTSAPAGGFLVQDDISSRIEYALRSASVCIRAGARVLPGLRGDLTLGKETTEVTYDWLAELEEASSADSVYAAVKMTPKRLAGLTTISTQLNAQSSPDISAFVIESLTRGLGAGLDRAAIQGIGVAGEPLGLLNRSGTQTVSFSGAATFAKAISFEAKISGANGDDDAITFVANPDVREKWRTLQRYSGSSTALWEGSLCADRRAYATTNCPTTKVLAGDFSQLVFATWGEGSPVSVIVDPFTSKKSGKVEILVSLLADVAPLREEVFCIGSDSAVQ